MSTNATAFADNGLRPGSMVSTRGELNIGRLCREVFGNQIYSIGFGTDRETVADASDWDGPIEVKNARPALADSYKRLFHETALPGFMLGLRSAQTEAVQGLDETSPAAP